MSKWIIVVAVVVVVTTCPIGGSTAGDRGDNEDCNELYCHHHECS